MTITMCLIIMWFIIMTDRADPLLLHHRIIAADTIVGKEHYL